MEVPKTLQGVFEINTIFINNTPPDLSFSFAQKLWWVKLGALAQAQHGTKLYSLSKHSQQKNNLKMPVLLKNILPEGVQIIIF